MKIKLEEIIQICAGDGWEVLSPSYTNLDSEMEFKCAEGHNVLAPWKKIRNQRECPICKRNSLKTTSFKVIPKGKKYRVLALDQASYISGWSIYDDKQLRGYGVHHTNADDDEIVRDVDVKLWLANMIDNWAPDLIAIEGIQFQEKMGVTTFQTLARLQGILMAFCQEEGVPYIICPTNTWRAHCGVTGRHRNDKKKSMQLLAKQWYDVSLTEDEADAVGIGKYAAECCSKKTEYLNWE